ncbi:MAG: hypothetical protein MUC34_03740 [Anaerolineae bacterium]|jgi:hypothetical protein|nr:hypothetical protein [Anaerolineae bacterium]
MNNHLEKQNEHTTSSRNAVIAGVAIIALGLVALASQLGVAEALGYLIPPTLAGIFLAWGLLTRTFGLIIPGGILSGVSLGIFVTQGPFAASPEPVTGGIFLLAFSLGWVLIALLSTYTAGSFQWWPLVPGAILAAIGALLLAGASGLAVLKAFGFIWPVILIVAGVVVLIRRK